MLLNQQSTVVNSTLQELMNRNREANAHRKTVIALLFYHMNGMDEGLNTLSVFRENNIQVVMCPDEQILEYYHVNDLVEQTGIDDYISLNALELQKEQFDHFYIPILPFSTVSDLLHFNDTRPSIRILLWALMKGKQVSALSAGADPYHETWQRVGMNHGTPFLKHEMKKQLQQVRGYGVHLVENAYDVLNHFQHAFEKESNHVITAAMIKKQAEAGQKLVVLELGTIITPLARDIARENKIVIREK